MKLKTLSDKAKEFKFKYNFNDEDTAKKAGYAITGYMLGTYEVQGATIRHNNKTEIEVSYIEDMDISETLERICKALNEH